MADTNCEMRMTWKAARGYCDGCFDTRELYMLSMNMLGGRGSTQLTEKSDWYSTKIGGECESDREVEEENGKRGR